MSKKLVLDQLKALEQFESSGRVKTQKPKRRRHVLATDTSKIDELRKKIDAEKEAAANRNKQLLGVLDAKKKEMRKDGLVRKDSIHYIKRIAKHRDRDHKRLYGKKDVQKKKKRSRPDDSDDDLLAKAPFPKASKKDDFDELEEAEEDEKPSAKKQKTAESDVDMAAFEKMAAQMMKGGDF